MFRMKKSLLVLGLMVVGLLVFVFGMPGADVATGVSMCAAPLLLTGNKKIIKSLREDKSDKKDEMRALVELSEKESRDFTESENDQYNQLKKDCENLEARALRLEALEADNEERAKLKGNNLPGKENKSTPEKEQEKYNTAFRKWAISGESRMKSEDVELLEKRAMSVVNASEGGYTASTTLASKIEEALLTLGGVRSVADVFGTSNGNIINYPTSNTTSEEGELIGENPDGDTSDLDPVFGNIAIAAYTYSSKEIVISNQLLQDSAFDIEGFIARVAAQRIFRITNKHFTLGTGTNQPKGYVTASPKGADAAATAITYDNLIDLFHSVDPAYRLNGSWMFNDNTLKAIKKLKDNEGKPVWQESLSGGDPSTIMGKPYTINQNVDDIASGKKSIAFGDFKKYLIRDVQNASLQRFKELRGLKNQTAFVLFSRHDGNLLDAGTGPIKHLLHA